MELEKSAVRLDQTSLWIRIKDNFPAILVIGLSIGLAVAIQLRGGSSILINTIITSIRILFSHW